MFEKKYTVWKVSCSHVTHNTAFAIIKESEKGEEEVGGGKSFHQRNHFSLCAALSVIRREIGYGIL